VQSRPSWRQIARRILPPPIAVVPENATRGGRQMSILWIILIVVLVLVLLGFVGRGRF
jgi:hypothetical protein